MVEDKTKTIQQKGGNAKLRKYGKDAYSEMGKKGGLSVKEKYGNDYYKELQRRSVESRKRNKLEREKRDPKTSP